MVEQLFKTLFSILMNQTGEYESGTGEGGQGEGAPESGQGTAPAEGEEGEAGTGEETPPAESKYGDFGDNPSVDDVYNQFTQRNQEYEALKGKTSATEKNLANLRKSVEGTGMKIMTDSSGNIHIIPKAEKTEGSQKSETLFSDEHAKLFDQPVLDAINKLIADRVKAAIKDYDSTRFTEKDAVYNERTSFQRKSGESRTSMLKFYPQLAAGKERDTAFHARATEIWEASYKHMPNGELIAAHEAAQELSIAPKQLMVAKKEGYEQGKAGKKVLGPVGGGQQNNNSGKFQKLSKADYLKLSSEDKDAYNLKALEISQKG
ncbi:MAG: hypothetical protein J7L96_03500 [Bacteroidales bacterium]|nr:hypothetical protein [Bacteroidales bacterium]